MKDRERREGGAVCVCVSMLYVDQEESLKGQGGCRSRRDSLRIRRLTKISKSFPHSGVTSTGKTRRPFTRQVACRSRGFHRSCYASLSFSAGCRVEIAV